MAVDAVVALLVTAALGALLVAGLGWHRPEEPRRGPSWETSAMLLAGMYLVVLFAGRWLRPFGFGAAGGTWTPFLLVGVLMALLILAVALGAPTGRPSADGAAGGAAAVARDRPAIGSTAAGVLLLGLLAALTALWVVLLVL